jgi:preprotein translocase subunit SecE
LGVRIPPGLPSTATAEDEDLMNWWTKIRTFLSEVRAEMKKVTYPSRDEVVSTSIVVVIASVIFGIFLWVSDMVIVKLYELITKGLGS